MGDGLFSVEKVEALLCFLDYRIGVEGPGEVLRQVETRNLVLLMISMDDPSMCSGEWSLCVLLMKSFFCLDSETGCWLSTSLIVIALPL